jgi:uncharacterized protein (TIGR02001 family)
MKRTLFTPLALGALTAAALGSGSAGAQQKEAFSVSGTLVSNLTLTSDYRFRGVSRTFGDPAIQGGADFTFPGNFYIGTWASMVDKEIFANSRGFELDIYGGYKWQMQEGLVVDVGLLQYLFPTESLYSTLEGYVGVSYQFLSFKYSHTLSNRFFGVSGARGSQYYDLTAVYPISEGFNAVAHYGVQRIHDNGGDYTDWRLGVTKEWKGLTFGASYFDTDSTFNFTNRAGRTRDLGDGGFVLSVSKVF